MPTRGCHIATRRTSASMHTQVIISHIFGEYEKLVRARDVTTKRKVTLNEH